MNDNKLIDLKQFYQKVMFYKENKFGNDIFLRIGKKRLKYIKIINNIYLIWKFIIKLI